MPSLSEYRRKRRFEKTPEPAGKAEKKSGHRFVVQKHAATRLHYDLRLEIDGVLKSWAVPKGPSLNPADKRLAVHVEDHPLAYQDFEGVIPKGQYGAGEVIVWDRGTFETEGTQTAPEQLQRGELKFVLHGQKLRGSFVLVKLRRSQKGNEWLLIKHKDAAADPHWNIDAHPSSVATGRTLEDVAANLPAQQTAESSRLQDLEGARKAAMPSRVEVTLATPLEKPFSDPDWLFEIKWDGVRAVGFVRDGKIELRSRTDRAITSNYPELGVLPMRLAARQAIVDGEIVALDERGRSDFEKLQTRVGVSHPSATLQQSAPVKYYLFDMLYCDGYDLRKTPLLERKLLLQRLLRPCETIRYSDHELEKGKELSALAQQQGLEGIVGKQIESPYSGRRTPLWAKFKVVRELDAVIGGWTAPRGSREHFGALLLGLFAGKKLQFVGGVGSGFTQQSQQETYELLRPLETARCPFVVTPKTKEAAQWVKPSLVARVKYSNWTREPRLRAPVFITLRKDARAEDCQFEAEKPAPSAKVAVAATARESPLARKDDVEKELLHGRAENVALELDGRRLKLTHLNKVYFPEAGYTKRDLLAYYYRIADYILPFLKDRPLVLRRYPDGIHGESFFQKEATASAPDWMRKVSVYSEERRARMEYFTADDRASLLYLTNLGCIDHNPWSSGIDDETHPDYVFFDLDPTEGTDFATVLIVARAVYERLRSLELTPYLKTSGATGFHLYIPLERGYTYEQARTFAEIVGRLIEQDEPKRVTLARSVSKRPQGRVLVDALQNARGKPLASVYSVRPFPKAPVSAPVRPEELRRKFRPEKWNLKTIFQRLKEDGDLWGDFWQKRQRLENATRLLSEQVSKPKTR